ncbi:hypothetical protein BLOT_011183 [Blomia tropicalis]|nr:hypothetical protein BLOT_011183 [Blomia tropicalis]
MAQTNQLKKHPNDQTASIALKINQIKSCVTAKYRHIPTKCNIADVLSRGTTLTNLISLDPWWVEPIIPEESRFILDTHEHTQIIAVTRTDNARVCPCVKVASYEILLNVFTNIAKILKKVPRYSALDPHDISLTLAIRHVQRSHFQHEIDALEANQSMDRGSVLRNYHCIIDPDGILRLETRLRPTGILSMNQVRPIIFPSGCHITEILIRYYHVSNYHCGMDRTISIIRDRYFIIGLRRSVKKLVNQCRICILKRRKAIEMSHGQVPPFRYDNTHPPFFNTGIDLFGPLKVKFTTPGKRYGVIFCCATTRAVHLETINGLTSEVVFQALRRFIARRGLPGLIYSDNGTQLVSIKKKLTQALHSIQQQRPDLELNLKWLHLTASSPWRGGFYERLIRIIKDSLIGITYRSTITDEDLTTHFFRGTSLRTISPVSRETRGCIAPTDLIQDYLRSRRHVNAIWRTWKNAYLLQLRNFHINRGPESTWNLVTGDTVYVKTPGNLDTWPLGRIVHTYPLRDGATRTVDVQYYDRRRLVTKTKDVRTVIPLECANQPHQ